MNTLRHSFALALVCSLFLATTACDTSFLNLDPKGEISENAVWETPSLIRSYLAEVYTGVGWGYENVTLASHVDEAKNTHGQGDAPIRLSNMQPTDRGNWDTVGRENIEKFDWASVYSNIRDLNIFLQNIGETDVIGSAEKEILRGEALFLRANFYHNLVRLYGGVPLLEEPFSLEGDLEQYQTPRNTFAETIDFIVSDLNTAANLLPREPRQGGSATEGAALALKSRILLFAASDLFANDKSPFDMAEVKYTSGSQQQRWQQAKDAAQAVMDMGEYGLYQGNYRDIWLNEDHQEIIWARYFTEGGGEQHDWSLWASPNGYQSWGGDTPTQQHVDAYEMADGSQFSWDNEEHAEHPYENRDPRFYNNIHFNGKDWRPRPSGLQGSDPRGVIQTGQYERPDGSMQWGLDTRNGPVQSWNGTWTGYYTGKFHDPETVPHQEQRYNPWIFIRYAEILLNYAEASAELGDTQDALQALNQVRSRVGMPDVPADGGPNRTLMERIRQEREVELAFEEFRYFDVRRWMIAPEVYAENGKGINVTGQLVDESDPDAELLVNNYYDFEYEVVEVDQRQWNQEAYFLPITQDEMNRNPELIQNPGY